MPRNLGQTTTWALAVAFSTASMVHADDLLRVEVDGLRIRLTWEAQPNVLLQRATEPSSDAGWEELLTTLGEGEYEETAQRPGV